MFYLYTFGHITIELALPGPAALAVPFQDDGPAPYWARLWPAAKALAGFIASHESLVAGKRVLELAGGLGLPGLVAAHWAKGVVLSDHMPEAVACMQASIQQNKLTNASARLLDWKALPEGLNADVLLLSDINYDPAAFDQLFQMVVHFLESGALILLATPQRLMAKPFVERLMPWRIRHEESGIPDAGTITYVSIMVLQAPPQ